MLHHRSLFALILGLGFLAGCTGHNGTASGVLPQADARGAMAFGGGGVPLGERVAVGVGVAQGYSPIVKSAGLSFPQTRHWASRIPSRPTSKM